MITSMQGIELGSSVSIVNAWEELPMFYNGDDDLFLKPPLTPIVKKSTA